MADDDTFDIDIYGDDDADENNAIQSGEPVDPLDNLYDDEDLNGTDYGHAPTEQDQSAPQEDPPAAAQEIDTAATQPKAPEAQDSTPTPQQGVKRKAPGDDESEHSKRPATSTPAAQSDPRPVDPGATSSLRLEGLHWWTTEEDLRAFCAGAQTEAELRDLLFGEHKINGKSRGEAFLEFASPQAATATKREVERVGRESAAAEGGGVRKNAFTAVYAPPNNPFRNSTGAAAGSKKEYPSGAAAGGNMGGRGGYNNFGNRGNFGGGGRGNFRGGFNNNNGGNMMRGQNQQQGGWGMNGAGAMAGMGGMGGMGAMGGFGGASNPMMGAFGGMGMPGFNMGRGGAGPMMGAGMNMMGGGRGGAGFGMGAMNMMGGMGGRGGAAMGRGGGWGGGGYGGGGMQQGFGGNFQQQPSQQQPQQQQGNKRPKTE